MKKTENNDQGKILQAEEKVVEDYFKQFELEKIVTFENRNIIIDYNKFLERDDLKNLSIYSIDIRCFFNEVEKITKSLNTVFNFHQDFIIDYLNMTISLLKLFKRERDENNSNKNLSEQGELELKELFYNFIENKEVKDIISDIVEDTYTISLDEESKSRSVNTDLQLIDKNNKIFLKTGFHLRLLIPLFSLIKKNYEINYFYVLMTNYIMKMYTENRTNFLINKIYKIICSRVYSRKLSDRVISL